MGCLYSANEVLNVMTEVSGVPSYTFSMTPREYALRLGTKAVIGGISVTNQSKNLKKISSMRNGFSIRDGNRSKKGVIGMQSVMLTDVHIPSMFVNAQSGEVVTSTAEMVVEEVQYHTNEDGTPSFGFHPIKAPETLQVTLDSENAMSRPCGMGAKWIFSSFIKMTRS